MVTVLPIEDPSVDLCQKIPNAGGRLFEMDTREFDLEVLEKLQDPETQKCAPIFIPKLPHWGMVWYEAGEFYLQLRVRCSTVAVVKAKDPLDFITYLDESNILAETANA